jgi:TIR domain
METSVLEIATFLKTRKSVNNRTVLFLGARAGGLFRNPIFYESINNFSKRSFGGLSDIDKFRECYTVLSDANRFTEIDVYDILLTSLNQSTYREEDEYLATLMKEDYFDIIISTNIDTLLESASREEMRELNDFNVFIAGLHSKGEIVRRGTKHCTIVKAFGDLDSRIYRTIGNEFNFDEDAHLKKFLESTLKRNILVVGFDSVWDRPIERAFPMSPEGSLWYVNEEAPADDSLIAKAIKLRKGKSLIGLEGSYKNFVIDLYSELIGGRPPRYTFNQDQNISNQQQPLQDIKKRQTHPQETTSPSTSSDKDKRKRVFISYSHKDTKYLERLHTHLAMYERNGLVDIWDDKKIAVGADWREEIKKALEETKVAVLLVSADFLASKFIAENELPPLLDAARAGGAKIFSVILRPCAFEDTPLYRYQAVNSPSNPLSSINPNEREKIWLKVAKLVKEA